MPLMLPPSPPALIQSAEQSLFAKAMLSADHGEFHPLEALRPTLLDPALAALARARLAASSLDHRRVRSELTMFFKTGDQRRSSLASAYSMAAADAFAAGDYGSADRNVKRWLRLLRRSDPNSEMDDARQLESLAELLSPVPRQHATSPIRGYAPTTRDAVGLIRTEVAVSGTWASAVLDTGANLSVVSSSLARRLGLKALSGAAAVGSSSRSSVSTHVAIAPRLDIAGVRLVNVAFLVLDDTDLALPVPGYRIDLIVGFPVLKALGRITFAPGMISVGSAGIRSGHAAPLRAVGNDLHVEAAINGVKTQLHLDTGATSSSLTALWAQEHPELTQIRSKTVRSAGAGGATERQAVALTDARVELAGTTTMLPSLELETTPSADVKTEAYGTLGQDALRTFHSYAVDFQSMTLEIE